MCRRFPNALGSRRFIVSESAWGQAETQGGRNVRNLPVLQAGSIDGLDN
uniref:Uncharacterized protein n=1 Tax=Arundo donax TaxID=35708 RepID=A0A0A9D519_ARUDO